MSGFRLFVIFAGVCVGTFANQAPFSDPLEVLLQACSGKNSGTFTSQYSHPLSQFFALAAKWNPGTDRPHDFEERTYRKSIIPEAMRRFYSSDDHAFKYERQKPLSLAVENGDAEITALQMNWSTKLPEFSIAYLADGVRALSALKTAELWIVGDPAALPSIQAQLGQIPLEIQKRIHVYPIPASFPRDRNFEISPYAQDGYKTGATGFSIVEPSQILRKNETAYQAAAHTLHAVNKVSVERSIFPFEGGNVIVGGKHIFVGSDVVTDTIRHLYISREEGLAALAQEYGKPVVELGSPSPLPGFGGMLRQADYHIDLTLMLVRDKRTQEEVVFLESPRLALSRLPFDSATGELTERESALKKKLETILGDEKKHRDLVTRQGMIDQIEKKMKDLGYRVELVPGFNYVGFGGREVFSSLNSMASKDHILLSQTGIRNWDEFTNAKFKSMGYEIVPMNASYITGSEAAGTRCGFAFYRK